jgi:hypothetical protein
MLLNMQQHMGCRARGCYLQVVQMPLLQPLCKHTGSCSRSRSVRIGTAAAAAAHAYTQLVQPPLRTHTGSCCSLQQCCSRRRPAWHDSVSYSLEHAVWHDAVCEVQLFLVDEWHPVLLLYVPAATQHDAARSRSRCSSTV